MSSEDRQAQRRRSKGVDVEFVPDVFVPAFDAGSSSVPVAVVKTVVPVVFIVLVVDEVPPVEDVSVDVGASYCGACVGVSSPPLPPSSELSSPEVYGPCAV
jgi:hypothetical protein